VFEMTDSSVLLPEPPASRRPIAPLRPHGAEHRATGLAEAPSLSQWLAAMLNEIDYGMLLIGNNFLVLHANHVAREDLDAQHPLRLDGSELRARLARDVAPLNEAVVGACQHGRRRLVALGEGPQRVSIAVVPLPSVGTGPTGALVMLGKRQVCQALSVEAFARCHKLTPAETVVLKALCSGARPSEIALQHGVALSTVRTQVSSIRAKTDAQTIGSLVRMVAMLPPMVSALRHAATASFDAAQRALATTQ
jgi:DNA-binding CsgD family transcriptional regulator